MKVLRPSEDLLVIRTDDYLFAAIFLFFFVGFGTLGVYRHFGQGMSVSSETFIGTMGAAITGLLGFLAFFECNRFTFDRSRRLVRWQRQRALWRRSGVLPFERIRSVVSQSPLGDDGIPSRRIALLTDGRALPISTGYGADPDGSCLRLVEEIRAFIGAPAEDALMSSVSAALAGGDITGAVRMLRQERQLSLTEARQLVDEMRRERSVD